MKKNETAKMKKELKLKQDAKKKAAAYYLQNKTKIINTAITHYYKNVGDHVSKRSNDIEIKRNVTFEI